MRETIDKLGNKIIDKILNFVNGTNENSTESNNEPCMVTIDTGWGYKLEGVYKGSSRYPIFEVSYIIKES